MFGEYRYPNILSHSVSGKELQFFTSESGAQLHLRTSKELARRAGELIQAGD